MIDAVALTGITISVAILLSAGIIPGSTGITLGAAWGVSFISLLYLVMRLAIWSVTLIVMSSVRVMLIGGFPKRKIKTIPLSQIWDIILCRSLPARLFGYGKFTLEFAPGRGNYKINFIAYPEQVYLELAELIFPANDEYGRPEPA